MNPPAGSQRIVPYLYYDDPRAALEHLCRVFGFEQTVLLEWPDGGLAHAEASLHGERAYTARDPEGQPVDIPRTSPRPHARGADGGVGGDQRARLRAGYCVTSSRMGGGILTGVSPRDASC